MPYNDAETRLRLARERITDIAREEQLTRRHLRAPRRDPRVGGRSLPSGLTLALQGLIGR